nr:MAG TPA: hypothetical protein [Caudoviricetes sp.]
MISMKRILLMVFIIKIVHLKLRLLIMLILQL